MKKTTTLLIAFALCISSLNLNAYNGLNLSSLPDKNHSFMLKPSEDSEDGVKGKIMITAGVGLNLLGTSLELRYLASSNYDFDGNISGHQTTPMFNAMVDYGLGKKVSVGVAFGYQTAKINFQDVAVSGDRYYDKWTRLHFAVRGDYYIVAKENISLYTGAKLGYNLYTVTTTIPQGYYPGYLDNLDVYPAPVSAQAHFGFSYYVNGMIGFNAEIGLGYGVPYLFAAGVAIKI